MLKDSSLVSTVGVWDLMYVARAQGRSEFKVLEMLIAASLIYWVMSIILEIAQARLERHFTPVDRGYSKSAEI
jgi:polar amino acid transport system permease protein